MPYLISLLLGILLQQSPQPQFGTIEGSVTKSGSAMAGAFVRVKNPMETFSVEATTDASGQFAIVNVPAGVYRVEIGGNGAGDRQGQSFMQLIEMAPGQRVRLPQVSLFMPGIIRGRVLDADDKGVSFVSMEFFQEITDGTGRRRWQSSYGKTITNDKGEYERIVYGSGDYYVRALTDSGTGRLAVYYPGTTEAAKAAPLILLEGSEVVADVRLGSALSEKSYQISGTVTLPPVEVAAPFIQLVLTARNPGGPVEILAPNAQASTRAADGVGNFEFRDVRPGDYEITATTQVDSHTYRARARVEVRDRDVDKVELVAHNPVQINGRLVVDGVAAGIRLRVASRMSESEYLRRLSSGLDLEDHEPGIVLSLQGSNSSSELVPVIDSAGTSFSYSGINEGEYKITARLTRDSGASSQSLYLADIRVGGQSVMDHVFEVGVSDVDSVEIVVGTQGGVIEGRVKDDSNSPVSLILLPESSRRGNPSFLRTMDLSNAGSFRIEGVSPGNYQIFAVAKSVQNPLRNLSQYEPRALKITVQKGKTSGGVEVPLLSSDK